MNIRAMSLECITIGLLCATIQAAEKADSTQTEEQAQATLQKYAPSEVDTTTAQE